VAFNYRSNKSGLITESTYTKTYKEQIIFFKKTDYIELDNFSASDLTVEEGSKQNGYTALTSQAKVVSQSFLNNQISTIDKIMADKSNDNWSSVVDQIQNNVTGLGKIMNQTTAQGQTQSQYLLNVSQYMGMTTDQLNAKKAQLSALNDGKSRNIILGELGMQSSGYVYASISPMEKVVNENILPYVDKSFLDDADKISRTGAAALKIVDNDHLFAAFVMGADDVLAGQDDAMNMKQKYMGTKDKSKNTAYYQFLVRRVDLLWEYPEVSVEKDGKKYSAYLVNVEQDGDNKIAVVMFKDYVNIFAGDSVLNANVDVQTYTAYKVPKSAITTENNKSYITLLEKDYFPKQVEVKVDKTEGSKAILKASDNPDLSVDMVYKVYP